MNSEVEKSNSCSRIKLELRRTTINTLRLTSGNWILSLKLLNKFNDLLSNEYNEYIQ